VRVGSSATEPATRELHHAKAKHAPWERASEVRQPSLHTLTPARPRAKPAQERSAGRTSGANSSTSPTAVCDGRLTPVLPAAPTSAVGSQGVAAVLGVPADGVAIGSQFGEPTQVSTPVTGPLSCGVGGAPRGIRTPNRQIRSQPSPVPARPPAPSASLLVLLNGHVTGSTRASVPGRHAPHGRNLVAVSAQRRQTGSLAPGGYRWALIATPGRSLRLAFRPRPGPGPCGGAPPNWGTTRASRNTEAVR
jgi:hypothetical protein